MNGLRQQTKFNSTLKGFGALETDRHDSIQTDLRSVFAHWVQ